MSNVNVRISSTTYQILKSLAKAKDQSMHPVIDQAIEDLRRRRLLDATNSAFSALKADKAVVSADIFNHGAGEHVVVIPVTSKAKGIPLHVEVQPPEGGLTVTSFVKREDLRSISTSRLVRRLGKVSSSTIDNVEDRLRILLGL